jgi:hypothetical protein
MHNGLALTLGLCLCACRSAAVDEARTFDVLIRGGTILDGSGGAPFTGDVGIRGDEVAALGDLSGSEAGEVIDARGLAVAPGFINVLSWATESLLVDPRALADIRQGVTLEVFGEGVSMGPLNAAMKAEMLAQQGDLVFPNGRRWASTSNTWNTRASRSTWPPSSARRPCASTSSATPIARPRRRSSSACARSCARRWKRARSASAPP